MKRAFSYLELLHGVNLEPGRRLHCSIQVPLKLGHLSIVALPTRVVETILNLRHNSFLFTGFKLEHGVDRGEGGEQRQ